MLRFDYANTAPFLPEEELAALLPPALEAHQTLVGKTGPGREMVGWRDLLLTPNDALLEDLAATAEEVRARADVLVCIGIGGSYLGAKAVIDALSPYYGARRPEVLFAGHHMSGAYLQDLLAYLEGKSVYLNVISKSGTTLEPALAFRILRRWMAARFPDADRRIIVTTDPASGALNQLQAQHGFKKYVIPPDVGGRFSVLTPVGLLPIAAAGIDIRSFFYGAVAGLERYGRADADNPALQYAAVRYGLLQKGFTTEVLAAFEPRLNSFGGWWQQLFGESEGKEQQGIYPDFVQYSTDLHSLGQYLQEGQRRLMETFMILEHDGGDLAVPALAGGQDLDGLSYLEGMPFSEINRKAYEGTATAHLAGGVPNATLFLQALTPEVLGACVYFFEHAVGIGGYLLGVNPFNQPGVEAYKKEMFRLLGRA